jgi:hypothetical protein
VDGDEEERSGAAAVRDGATGDGAEQSGDTAPSVAEAEPRAAGSVVTDPAEVDAAAAAMDDAVMDDAVMDDVVTSDALTIDAMTIDATEPRRLGPHLRRGVVALVAVGVVALVVSALAWVVPSLDGANRRFIEEVQSHGHAIAPGEQEMLVLSAARKICDRKVAHDTVRERRSTALTSAELAAVGAVFGPRTGDFTALALDTYCSS